MNRNVDYDLVILGGGPAGIVAGIVAGSAGLRTLVVEKSQGGAARASAASVPARTLIHAAHVAHQIRTADHLGLKSVTLTRADAADVLRHVRSTLAREETSPAPSEQLRKHGVQIRIGDPRFISPDALELSEREGPTHLITAEHFLLATGSSPARPAIPALASVDYTTNHDVHQMSEVPETLIVIGGGSSAVEMAQAFSRLGSRVTLLARGGRLLPGDDFEAADVLANALREEGIDVRLDAEVLGARMEGPRKVVRIRESDGESDVSARELLVAAGWTPNVEGLGLDSARVEYTSGGVKVNSKLHTTGPRVWACGDVIGRYQFSNMAEAESKLVVHNILHPFAQRTDPGHKLAPWVTFTDPEVARVGLTEQEAQDQGTQYQVFRRSLEESELGFVKVLATGWQGKVLGAHIVGPRAGDLIQEWTAAIADGRTMRQVADAIRVAPAASPVNPFAAEWDGTTGEVASAPGIRANLAPITAGLIGLGLLAGGALALQYLRGRD